jgi:hypothetical protein
VYVRNGVFLVDEFQLCGNLFEVFLLLLRAKSVEVVWAGMCKQAYDFRPQLLLKTSLLLVQRTEAIDLFLVFAAHLHVLAACRGFLLFGELQAALAPFCLGVEIRVRLTMRRCIVAVCDQRRGNCDVFSILLSREQF